MREVDKQPLLMISAAPDKSRVGSIGLSCTPFVLPNNTAFWGCPQEAVIRVTQPYQSGFPMALPHSPCCSTRVVNFSLQPSTLPNHLLFLGSESSTIQLQEGTFTHEIGDILGPHSTHHHPPHNVTYKATCAQKGFQVEAAPHENMQKPGIFDHSLLRVPFGAFQKVKKQGIFDPSLLGGARSSGPSQVKADMNICN
jgi:hypothetical protein